VAAPVVLAESVAVSVLESLVPVAALVVLAESVAVSELE
jgi:hypothetical protein